MATPMACDEARQRIPHYRDGWIGPDERGRLEGHLAQCRDCAGLLRSSRTRTRPRPVRSAGPSPVLPSPGPEPARAARPGRGLALLTTGLPLLVAALLIASRHPARPPHTLYGTPLLPGPIIPMPQPYPSRWADVHTAMALSDASGDPNRAVVLLSVPRGQELGR